MVLGEGRDIVTRVHSCFTKCKQLRKSSCSASYSVTRAVLNSAYRTLGTDVLRSSSHSLLIILSPHPAGGLLQGVKMPLSQDNGGGELGGELSGCSGLLPLCPAQ
jgi:hypothetical protein